MNYKISQNKRPKNNKNKHWSIFYTNVLLVLHQSKEFNGDNILFYLELELRPSSTLWIGNMSYDDNGMLIRRFKGTIYWL